MIKTLIERYILTFSNNEKKINYSRKLGVVIGNNCTILGRAIWGSEPYLISIGNNVRITSGVRFVTHDGGVHVLRNYLSNPNIDLFGAISIGNNVFIGVETIILPGVCVGDNVIIGAKSVVTKNLESNSVYAGNPARYICSIEEYIEKKDKNFEYTKGMSVAEKKKYLLNKYIRK